MCLGCAPWWLLGLHRWGDRLCPQGTMISLRRGQFGCRGQASTLGHQATGDRVISAGKSPLGTETLGKSKYISWRLALCLDLGQWDFEGWVGPGQTPIPLQYHEVATPLAKCELRTLAGKGAPSPTAAMTLSGLQNCWRSSFCSCPCIALLLLFGPLRRQRPERRF